MAYVIRKTGQTYSSIPAAIGNLGLSFVSRSGNTLTIGGRITLSWSYQKWYISVDGGGNTEVARIGDPQTLTIVYNNNFLYFQTHDSSNRRGTFIYEVINGKKLYGRIGNGGSWSSYHVFYNLHEITLYDLDDSTSTYVHKQRLNYGNPLGSIDFTSERLFLNGYKDMQDQNFVACSTITGDQVLTIKGVNYYSIGTNCLVKIDT